MYKEILQIYDCLQDDESRILFDARIAYLVNHNKDEFVETVWRLYSESDWHSRELEERIDLIKPKGIIIFGCGNDGKMTNRLLKLMKYETSIFCDNNKHGEIFDGKRVISIEEVVKSYKEYLVIIASLRYGKDMYIELVEKGFQYSHILFPRVFSYNTLLWGSRGKQYFDVFKPQPEEVYVDAGAFDGGTVLDFAKWANNQYKAIYAFEPMDDMCRVMQRKVEENNITKVETLHCAAWSKKEELNFTNSGVGSHRSSSGDIVVQGMDIDSVVGENKVTFIKMDIEGSELEALKGAKNTIINNRPRLAICIYHKPMDIIEIPSYILHLVPEYKFYIRHYDSSLEETVLYAAV